MICRLCLHLFPKDQQVTTLRGAGIHADTKDCTPLKKLRERAAALLAATKEPR